MRKTVSAVVRVSARVRRCSPPSHGLVVPRSGTSRPIRMGQLQGEAYTLWEDRNTLTIGALHAGTSRTIPTRITCARRLVPSFPSDNRVLCSPARFYRAMRRRSRTQGANHPSPIQLATHGCALPLMSPAHFPHHFQNFPSCWHPPPTKAQGVPPPTCGPHSLPPPLSARTSTVSQIRCVPWWRGSSLSHLL